MEPITPLKISASAVRAYRECPYRYARDYVVRLPASERDPIGSLAIGTAIHKAIAQFHRRGGWQRNTIDDLIIWLRRDWNHRAFADEPASLTQFKRACELLEVFFETPVYGRPYDLAIEAYVSWQRYHNGLLATGRLDRVVMLPTGKLVVVDYKTGRRPWEAYDVLEDAQALFYHTLATETYRGLGHKGVQVAFVYLDRKAPIVAEFSPEEFADGWTSIEAVANAMRRDRRYFARGLPLDEAFVPSPGDRCHACPMRRHCKSKGFMAKRQEVANDRGL